MAQPFAKPGATASGTVIGNGLVIEGEITGNETVTIEGTVKGRIALTAALAVDGDVEADIEATEVRVGGTLTGNVAASERVEITSDGRLIGDVRSPRISIAEGATFKGHIDMDS